MTSQDDAAILENAKSLLREEADALTLLAQTLNGPFVQAVALLLACKGRVIVSGMGKSGHIARKIAATFASTGTPASFVHPGEASHGDLGMIVQGDTVVAISNSGEAPELSDLVHYTRRFGIPLVAITSRKESSLAREADVVLLLAPVPEAKGALGLAPTTSTTMTLALGDALAVACIQAKGFTADDYRNFHPGGKLGKKLLRLEKIMHKGDEIPLALESDGMDHVLVVMTEKRFGCAGILDAKGCLVGMVTDGDLRRHMGQTLTTKKACEVMTGAPMTMPARLLAAEALKILNEKQRTQVFVVDDDGKPEGIVHLHDLLRIGVA